MTDNGKRIGECSDDELQAEVARRRLARGFKDITAAEDAGEVHAATDSEQFLVRLIREREAAQTRDRKPCPQCGKPCRVRVKNRPRSVRSTLGQCSFSRHYHYCKRCGRGFYPLDNELGLPMEGEVTAKFSGRVLDFGVNTTFVEAAARWSVHHMGTISDTMVRDVVDRAGRALEAKGPDAAQRMLGSAPTKPVSLLIVQTDGSMLPMRGEDGWREAKLGVIYREEHHTSKDDAGRSCITEARYAATLGGVSEFRHALDAALRVEDVEHAQRVAWIGDGAPWNWTLADEICPKAVQVLDWTHSVEHANECATILFGENSLAKLWVKRVEHLLWNGETTTLFDELEACRFLARGPQRAAIVDLTRYYRTNERRIQYAEFRALNIPIGSGTVESGHRHVFQKRMKQSGQHWSVRNARRMVQLRAAYKTAGPQPFMNAMQVMLLAAA